MKNPDLTEYHARACSYAGFVEELLTASNIECVADGAVAPPRYMGLDDFCVFLNFDLDSPLELQRAPIAVQLARSMVTYLPERGQLVAANQARFSRLVIPTVVEPGAENIYAGKTIIRYVEAWDVHSSKHVHRGDMLLKFYFPALPEPAISPAKET